MSNFYKTDKELKQIILDPQSSNRDLELAYNELSESLDMQYKQMLEWTGLPDRLNRLTEITAKKIADYFGNDSRCFYDKRGVSIQAVCKMNCETSSIRRWGDPHFKYTFYNGSSIVIAGDRWDLPISDQWDCYCLAESIQHDNNCRYSHKPGVKK